MPDSAHVTPENRLLGMLQSGFPLCREPYDEMGAGLGISGDAVIIRIVNLKKQGIVRQISPVLDARKLGFQSTLIAMKVDSSHTKSAEDYLMAHSGISHGYEREHEFNIWVTLSVPPRADLQAEVTNISAGSHARETIALPAVKVFKLRTNFSHNEDTSEEEDVLSGNGLPVRARLSKADKQIINGLQHDLPLSADPFTPLARSLGMDVDEMLAHSRALLRRGIIRRYGASINHRNAGYRANAMTCWYAPAGRVDELGRLLASDRHVSHCYERLTIKPWHYNLFAMVHSRDKAACLQIIERMAAVTGLTKYVVLFSIKEFKKTRILYRV
ncbi:MAG: Lrp/AsnC family transcriptional regulator [Dehalococcoidia bacterium]|nr:Lrp/AsnC family transcriptional regulator [Dehalococcoidia bacterium]